MMQAGKDYIAKGEPEDENARFNHLRELIRVINANASALPEVDEASEEKPEAEDKPEVKVPEKTTNQNKPTLKLK